MKQIYTATLFLMFINCLSAQVTILDDSIPSGKNFKKAYFRLWYKQDIEFIEGVIVLMPGSNSDGRECINDTCWQNLAVKNNLALLGCYYTDFPHENMDIEEYVNVKEGSGQALLDVLERNGKTTNHIELSDTPLLLWGISAGGEFNYEFVCWKPERVAAFIVNKGGVYYTALCSPKAREVPGLFFTGEQDLEFRSKIVEGIFTINRRFGALWAYVQEPCTEHEIGQSQTLSILFFRDMIRMRIPERGTDKQQSVEFLNIKQEDGYLGDFKLKIYYPFEEYKETSYPTAWLPSRIFAQAWLQLIKRDCSD